MKCYDIHAHLGKTSSGEAATAAMLLDDLEMYNITKVGVSSLSGTSIREQNDLVYRAMKEFPDKIYGYAFINPKAADAAEEIDRCLGEYKMNGIKFHSWKHGYYADNTPSLDRLLEQIEGYGVHVQTHVGTSPLSTPFPWAEYAKNHPNINFLFTHLGYYEFGYSTIAAVKDLNNVRVETSGQMEKDVLMTAIKELGTKRIVFGTDWPYKIINIEIDKFNYLGLNEAQSEDIFYKNAETLWQRRV